MIQLEEEWVGVPGWVASKCKVRFFVGAKMVGYAVVGGWWSGVGACYGAVVEDGD